MQSGSSHPKSREGAGLWLVKMVTGPLIIIILLIHFVVNHLIAPGGLLTYAEVIAYYRIPIIPIMEAVFVVIAVVHSLLGLRSILLDLKPSVAWLKTIDVLMVLLGAVSITYGIRLIVVLTARGLL